MSETADMAQATPLSPLELTGVIIGALAFVGFLGWILYGQFRIVEEVGKAVTSDLDEPMKTERILTCPQGVVRYRIASDTILDHAVKIFTKETLEKRIKEILETDPDADLKEYEKTLGIKVLSQRKSKKARGKSGYVGWSE